MESKLDDRIFSFRRFCKFTWANIDMEDQTIDGGFCALLPCIPCRPWLIDTDFSLRPNQQSCNTQGQSAGPSPW